MRKSVPFAVPIARLLRRVPIVALIVMLLPGMNLTIETRAQSARAESLIGYTELNTNLTGGRHANIITMRAVVSRADGSDRRLVAEELVREPNSWTQFAGWSPDGRLAIIGRGWEDPENGRWEEEHKQFRHTAAGWLYDMFLVNLATGANTNVTAVDRVSFYNTGLFFWPGDPTKLGFQAIVDGNSHPFQMDRDGKNKRDLTKDSQEFAYGFSGSPDGRRIAYHKSYQVYVADADGSNAHKISTGQPFRITLEGPSERLTQTPEGSLHYHPQPSPDGHWLAYGSKRDGVRQLYVMRLEDRSEYRITRLERGRAAMWPYWQPRPGK
jgi:Tol biopolymer transport system component